MPHFLFRVDWLRACPISARFALPLILAAFAVGLAGCGPISIDISGNDQYPSSSEPSATDRTPPTVLTLTEYVDQCIAHRTKPSGDYATSFEAVAALRDMARHFEGMSPPAEVAEVHRARLALVDKQIEVLSQNPPDSSPTFGIFLDLFQPELASVWQAYNESQYTLTAETRQLLLTRGCMGTEDEIRKAQPTLAPDEKRSIEEYARWCSFDELKDDGNYLTYGELTSAFSRELARYESVTPPPELASLDRKSVV